MALKSSPCSGALAIKYQKCWNFDEAATILTRQSVSKVSRFDLGYDRAILKRMKIIADVIYRLVTRFSKSVEKV
jgi:hypothetical protein